MAEQWTLLPGTHVMQHSKFANAPLKNRKIFLQLLPYSAYDRNSGIQTETMPHGFGLVSDKFYCFKGIIAHTILNLRQAK